MPFWRVRLRVEVAELLLEHAVDAARLLLLTKLEQVLALTDATAAVQTRRVRPALDRAPHRVALGALQEELHALAPAEPAHGTGVTSHQTLRRLGGRQPLCGMGVTSLMPTTSMPAFWMDRIAVSRPDPGPFTTTSTLRTPCSIARRGRGLGRELRRERRALARALEPDVAGRGPRERVALLVGDRDDRVVERRLDVRDPVGDVLALTTARPPSSSLWFCHRLLTSLLLAGDGLLRTLAGACIGTGALTAHRKTTTVTDTAVASRSRSCA